MRSICSASEDESTSSLTCCPSLDEMWEAGIPGTLRKRLANAGDVAELDGQPQLIPLILCLNKVHAHESVTKDLNPYL